MKVTVCELCNDSPGLEKGWRALVRHVKAKKSHVVLLPEMVFYPWLPWSDQVDEGQWRESVETHGRWLERFQELSPAIVLSTRPVIREKRRLNEAFVWSAKGGYQVAHHKYYLPDEPGFWEATWYQRLQKNFTAVEAGPVMAGFLVCTELWFTEHARAYARQGIHILACPRASNASTVDKWFAGGRAAAVMSGAYCLSSNIGGTDSHGVKWTGCGWIIEPENGEVLGQTNPDRPFLTLDIDPSAAERAKLTYPRYVKE